MAIFLLILLCTAGFLYPSIHKAFANNIPLNGFIILTLLFGISWVFWQFSKLLREQKWLNSINDGKERFPDNPTPSILVPLWNLLDDTRQGSIS
jgi:high-affinity Fe2+/Pb2+ permease